MAFSTIAWSKIFPVLEWGSSYGKSSFQDDLISGLVVTFITVPQVIAYAFLAGLPAEVGLYAAIAATCCYAFLGTGRTLAVGPTAIVAMMAFETVSSLVEPGSAAYMETMVRLTLITGLVLVCLRVVNFGSMVNFMSHAVVTGFITAAAVLIIINQLTAIFGIPAADATGFLSVLLHLMSSIEQINLTMLWISVFALMILWFCRGFLESILLSKGVSKRLSGILVKSAPMYVVVLGVVLVWSFDLVNTAGVSIIGTIPTQLPAPHLISVSRNEFISLLPSAFLIALVIFIESTSIGSVVASKRREKIDPNQELVGLGAANIGAALFGGFPVAGSFGRTMVNFSAGAVTPIASLITAACVVVTLTWLTQLFFHLPVGILAVIIVIAASQLIDVNAIRRILTFNRTDAVTLITTFIAVLATGVETGILIGVGISFMLLIRSSSKPHIAVVGRYGNSEHFRNVLRHEVSTIPNLLMVRIDESLYFVNSRYVETFLLDKIADNADLDNILLICTAINFIDASGLAVLESLNEKLYEAGVTLNLAEIKGPVMDTLDKTDFYQNMHGKIFFTTDLAMKELADE
ncbi:MAG: sulfate permease [Gammaproteobacteria bacterium]|nr:sulfate permease [Gammaproteobacteria bacterium]